MIDRNHIAILTTVANQALYERTSPLFPEGIRRFVIDGSKGMHGLDSIRYMMRRLRNRRIEWLVMADEDVIFTAPEEVFSIIDTMKEEGYTVAGVRDGGVVKHRTQNPAFVNTFFCILHFSEIQAIYSEAEVLSQAPVVGGEFPRDWGELPFPYDEASMYEPYYRFFAWLKRKGKKTLFLESTMPFPDDGIANDVWFNGKRLLYHTWYARSYGDNRMHTDRINAILATAPQNGTLYIPPIVFKDRFFPLRLWFRRKKTTGRNYFRRIKGGIGL